MLTLVLPGAGFLSSDGEGFLVAASSCSGLHRRRTGAALKVPLNRLMTVFEADQLCGTLRNMRSEGAQQCSIEVEAGTQAVARLNQTAVQDRLTHLHPFFG